jgi:hypothetical protein
MLWPLMNPTTTNCDYDATVNGGHCVWNCPGCGSPKYAADKACPGRCDEHYPGLPSHAGSVPSLSPKPPPGGAHSFAIEDGLKVPSDAPPGEYVLGWRWDCETSSQVWQNCADITIV